MADLSISNIAWGSELDDSVYTLMKKYQFSGLEIAPTRVFPKTPYEKKEEAGIWSEKLRKKYGFTVPSMQSIWFGRQEKIFGTREERQILIKYTKKAIDFAKEINCKNLVFGCPYNRKFPEGADLEIGVTFFREIGEYAADHSTVIGMEANPKIYNTNYINDTLSALELIEKVNSRGFLLNLDVGTMIQNQESVTHLIGKVDLINHVHISEPGLKIIVERKLHTELKKVLEAEGYRGFVSIEIGKLDDIQIIDMQMRYVKNIFG